MYVLSSYIVEDPSRQEFEDKNTKGPVSVLTLLYFQSVRHDCKENNIEIEKIVVLTNMAIKLTL
jgi:hypothetical protein